MKAVDITQLDTDMPRPKPKTKPDAVTDRLYVAVEKFLRANGWDPLVIGGCAVQQPMVGGPYHFEFVVRFMGRKPADGETAGSDDFAEPSVCKNQDEIFR